LDKITVIIVDDHPIFRQGVVDSLSVEADIDIVAQAENGEKGLALIRIHRPRVAILDINLPGMNGLDMTRKIIGSRIPTRIILLTAYTDQAQKIQGLHQGAAAYCTKDIQPDQLARVIRVVEAGNYWVETCEYDTIEFQDLISGQKSGVKADQVEIGNISEPLSAREMEILACITRGMSNKEIANRLGISHQTVKNHVTSVLRKLGVNDRTQAALSALQYGWVRLNE
jgi:DNA-binding NarL/FixJ family response regulator